MPANPLNIDPSRTTTIRRQYVAEMNKRFRWLRGRVKWFLVEKDALGLKQQTNNEGITTNLKRREFQFLTDDAKLEVFRQWLNSQFESGILQKTDELKRPWNQKFIQSAYKKGIVRAWIDTNATDFSDNPNFYDGTKRQFLQDAFASPEATSKIRLLATRSFEQLRGVTGAMAQQMNLILADGMANGRGASSIARDMNSRIQSLTRTRARTIARTEVIHAHAEGQLDSFERMGVKKIQAKAEWMTAGDTRVCVECASMEGRLFTISEARSLIPLHPNCRCAWVPANVSPGKQELKERRRRRRQVQERAAEA